MICADASVAAKWFFAEEHAAQASALLRDALARREPLVAPPLLPARSPTSSASGCGRGRCGSTKRAALLAQFLALPIRLQAPETRYDRALGGRLPFVRWIGAYGT